LRFQFGFWGAQQRFGQELKIDSANGERDRFKGVHSVNGERRETCARTGLLYCGELRIDISNCYFGEAQRIWPRLQSSFCEWTKMQQDTDAMLRSSLSKCIRKFSFQNQSTWVCLRGCDCYSESVFHRVNTVNSYVVVYRVQN